MHKIPYMGFCAYGILDASHDDGNNDDDDDDDILDICHFFLHSHIFRPENFTLKSA